MALPPIHPDPGSRAKPVTITLTLLYIAMAWPQHTLSLGPGLNLSGFTLCLSFYIWNLDFTYADRFARSA